MKIKLFIFFLAIYMGSFGTDHEKIIWDHLLKMEGTKVVKEPTGDYSKFGLRSFYVKEYNKKFKKKLKVRNLKEENARDIFREVFYKKYKINQIENLDKKIVITDTIYHQGTAGIVLIQRALNKLKEENEKTLEEDGVFGKETLQAINKVDSNEFKKILRNKRISYYKTRKNFKRYGKGWLKRLNTVFSESHS